MSVNLPYSFEKFPEELRSAKLWVLCRHEDSDDRERCKVPKRVSNPQVGADSTDRGTWSSYQAALDSFPKLTPLPKYAGAHERGLGCVIADRYVGVDLDHCWDDAKIQLDEV